MIFKNDYDQVIKVETENESKLQEITLEKGGEQLYIKVGNTVVNVMHGYNHGETEPCSIVEIYPYENKKQSRVLVYDDKNIILSR
jgi:hypothetical protein